MPYRSSRMGVTRLSALAIVVLAVAVAAAVLAVSIYLQLERDLSKPRENLQWAVYQLQAEHLRVMLSAHMGIEGEIDVEELDQAYQIFASRVVILVEGGVFAPLRALPGYSALLDDFTAAISEIDASLSSTEPTASAYADRLLETLPSFSDRLQSVAMGIVADSSAEQTARQVEMLETMAWLVGTLVLIVGASLMLGGVTVKQLAALEASRRHLAAALDRAEESSRAKGRFLAGMSHEMRTPLNAVIGLLREIGYRTRADSIRELVSTADASAQMLSGLIDDVIDTTRIETGKFQLTEERFDPRTLIEEVARVLASAASDRRDRIVLETGELGSLGVVSDRTRLKQVLINLVGKAIKFTHGGTITISARIEQTGGARGRLMVAVADTGIGIDRDKVDSIFKRFFQAEIGGGLGLGLTISQDIVERLGGRISVESELGDGSTFTFEIPVDLVEAVPVPTPAMFGFEERPLAGVRVLVAEDNSTNRLVIEFMLRRAGADFAFAHDGGDAVARAIDGEFDIVLMDINMPVLDGLGARDEIERRMGDAMPPMIALTADALSEDVERFLAAGMRACVTKPIDERELIQRMRQVLGETPSFLSRLGAASDAPSAEAPPVDEGILNDAQRGALLDLVADLDAQAPGDDFDESRVQRVSGSAR